MGIYKKKKRELINTTLLQNQPANYIDGRNSHP